MGLDSVIKYFNGDEYSSHLPKEISNKFESVKEYKIVGFEITKYENYNYISFRGKAYFDIIKKITNKSLYTDLKSDDLKEIYMRLEEKINNFYDIEEVNKAYENTYNLKDWTEHIYDIYIPSPNEIIGLIEIFRICYENKLMIYPSY